MDILEIIKTIIAPLVTILPALAILGKIKEVFEVYEKSPWSKRNKIKKALENPYLNDKSKQSYGRNLTKLDFKSIYRFAPPVNYINKMLKIEQISQHSIDIDDFALAVSHLDFKNGDIIIKDRLKWYKLNREYKLWMSFIIFIISIIGFFYLIILFNSSYFLAHYHFNKPVVIEDFIFTACVPVYFMGALIARDDAKSVNSLIKILEFGKSNPLLIKIEPSNIP